MDFNGILTIRNVQPEDAGMYVCTGSNMYDMDVGVATLYVQGGFPHTHTLPSPSAFELSMPKMYTPSPGALGCPPSSTLVCSANTRRKVLQHLASQGTAHN